MIYNEPIALGVSVFVIVLTATLDEHPLGNQLNVRGFPNSGVKPNGTYHQVVANKQWSYHQLQLFSDGTCQPCTAPNCCHKI